MNPRQPSAVLFAATTLIAASQLIGCTQTSSSVIEPTADKCADQIALSSSPSSFSASGGDGTLEVRAARDCVWTARSDASWISLDGQVNGQGAATVPYEVAVNLTPVPRRGALRLGSMRVEIAQEAAACRYVVYRGNLQVPAQGGALSVYVAAQPGCSWSVRSEAPWVEVRAGASGSGPGEVMLDVAPNAGAARSGVVRIEDQSLTISQEKA